LTRFKSTEWSGPAWYTVNKREKNGFPSEVSLSHFIPIDLGHGTETEIDGEKLGRLLPKVYKRNAKLQKAYLGLIHSHHTMGAFFSGTDKDTALEQAPLDGLFFTTVVASDKDDFCTGVSYRDHFGFPNFIEGDIVTHYKQDVPKEWVAEAKTIEKDKKKETKVAYVGNNQINMMDSFDTGYNGFGYGYGSYGGYNRNEAASDEKKSTKQGTIILGEKSKSSTSV
jgi:hypothetical protein